VLLVGRQLLACVRPSKPIVAEDIYIKLKVAGHVSDLLFSRPSIIWAQSSIIHEEAPAATLLAPAWPNLTAATFAMPLIFLTFMTLGRIFVGKKWNVTAWIIVEKKGQVEGLVIARGSARVPSRKQLRFRVQVWTLGE